MCSLSHAECGKGLLDCGTHLNGIAHQARRAGIPYRWTHIVRTVCYNMLRNCYNMEYNLLTPRVRPLGANEKHHFPGVLAGRGVDKVENSSHMQIPSLEQGTGAYEATWRVALPALPYESLHISTCHDTCHCNQHSIGKTYPRWNGLHQ